MLRYWVVVISLITITTNVGFAITLEKAIEQALSSSDEMRIVVENALILRESGRQSSFFAKPQARLSAGYIELDDNYPGLPKIPNMEWISMFETPKREISGEISGSQLIFAGGRIWNAFKLEKNLGLQARQFEISGKRDIIKKVRIAFDTVLYRNETIKILSDRLSQRQAEFEDAQDLNQAGVTTSLDVRQAKLNINFAKDSLKSGEAAYQEALINFNLSLGREGQKPLWPADGKLQDIPELTAILNQLESKMTQNDLHDLTAVKTQVQSAKLNYQLSTGSCFPEVRLVASAKSSGEEFDGMNETYSAGVQMRWDIFDGQLKQSQRAAARAKLSAAQNQLAYTQKHLTGAVEAIRINMNSLTERVDLQKETVLLSKENYEDARGHYRAGTITLTRLGEFSLLYAEARYNLNQLYFSQRQLLTQAEALLYQE